MRDRLQKLEVFEGDMLKDTGIMVIPVNCVPGVMGKGLAKQFADVCPEAKKDHSFAARTYALRVGDPRVCYGLYRCPVVMFPTKKHWKDPSKLEYIISGLSALRTILCRKDPEDIKYPAIIMPALGCGLGGLAYADVYPLIANFAHSLPEPYHVRLYRPHYASE